MNKYNESENLLGNNNNLREKINKLEDELVEIYKYLYPDYKDIIKNKYGISDNFGCWYNFLAIMRDYHKKQLEKEKMKKLIKECMEEINNNKE